MESYSRICRLCFNKCDGNFEAIEEITIGILDVLLIKINVVVSEEPVMCTECAEIIQNSFEFKSTCLYTQVYIVPFVNEEKNSKLNLREIYRCKKGHEDIEVSEADTICAFCMNLLKSCPYLSLDNKDEDVTLVKTMLHKCLPDMDLSIIENPIICIPCHGFLQTYCEFMENCLIIEEKIKKYQSEAKNKSLIKLNDVLQFTSKNISSCKGDDDTTNVFQIEQNSYLERKDLKVEVKEESDDFMEEEDENCLLFANEEIEIKTEQHNFDSLQDTVCSSHVSLMNTEIYKGAHKEHGQTNHFISEVEGYKYERSSFGANRKYQLTQHMMNYANVSEIRYKCKTCPTTTKCKYSLKKHMLIHQDFATIPLHKCEMCSYMTRFKSSLKRHMLIHLDFPAIPVYKCETCSFQTKFKSSLQVHMVKHQDPSDVTFYKCATCFFQTRIKRCLIRHMQIHQDDSEATIYKCETCSFQTKFKCSLKTHSRNHQDCSDLTVYKCEICPYQTKLKGNLKKHMLIHQDVSNVTIYKCKTCSFQTKFKNSLQLHFLNHQNRSDVTLYKCQTCSYQTKLKGNLKKHMLIHQDVSNVTIYKCETCSFQTKFKNSLQIHLLSHQNHLDVTVYKCETCSYQTKLKGNLKKHMLIHQDISDVTIYNCETCSFQTKFKNSLQIHVLNHRDRSDVTVYKCETCSYQTKVKQCLKKHMLIHKK